MTITSQAIKGASWLAFFKIISQACSWVATIIVTRKLTSEDYGLMELATMFTGFVGLFVEFGIGSAIINKDSLDQDEASTAFWFSTLWGFLLSLSCFALAPVTASYYSEPRIYYLTQAASLLFILGSLAIVPRSILQRELRFKEIAIIEFITIIISCILMILFAYQGLGPWTLLGGFISREICRFILFFMQSKFTPKLVFSRTYLSPLIRFGTPVMLSSSLFYLYNKADRFFGGSTFGIDELGFYAMALQIAAIPVEKIVSLLQGVLYPTLSKLKYEFESFNHVYLSFISIIAIITLPLFVGGTLVSSELVVVFFGEKWSPAIAPIKILLIAQLFIAISAPNSLIHAALGKPNRNLYFNFVLTPLLILGFYYSSQLTPLYKLAIPWITIFPVLQIIYIAITNKEIGISFLSYIKSLLHPVTACCLMSISVILMYRFWPYEINSILFLGTSITLGAATYILYFLTFGKKLILELTALKEIS